MLGSCRRKSMPLLTSCVSCDGEGSVLLVLKLWRLPGISVRSAPLNILRLPGQANGADRLLQARTGLRVGPG